MKKNFRMLMLFALLCFSSSQLFAQNSTTEIVDIRKLDRSMTLHKTQKRTFKNKQEFRRYQNRRQKQIKHTKYTPHMSYSRSYRDEAYRSPYQQHQAMHGYKKTYPSQSERGYRHTKRGWVLAYIYDRADFYDRDGFHYGYFNRYGYIFEGEFYRYDRYYRYSDRIRGRGLFDRYYYRPADWRYYGFCR